MASRSLRDHGRSRAGRDGAALLAGLSPDEFAARFPSARLESRTPSTISSRTALDRCLAEVRSRGYAEDREELEAGLRCVAAPVFDRTGTVLASVSLSGPVSRINDETLPGIAIEVRRTATQISTRLGAPRHIPRWPA